MRTSSLISDIQGLDAVWRRITDVGQQPRRSAGVEHWVSELRSLELRQREITAGGGWASGPSTLLGVLELDRAEVVNCRALRWLLDPISRHGLGAIVLGDLAKELGLHSPAPGHARVRLEVSRPTSRADIVIEGLVEDPVVIEAKIDAAEGTQQAQRLETDWPEAIALVFLTARGGRIPFTASEPERWHPLSWEWFATRTTDAMAANAAPADARAVDSRRALTAWIDGVRRSLR